MEVLVIEQKREFESTYNVIWWVAEVEERTKKKKERK